MSNRPPFEDSELQVIGGAFSSAACPMFPGKLPPEPLFNRPITPRENLKLAFSGQKPYWIPQTGWCFCDVRNFRPRQIPDNYATHLVFDGGDAIEYDSMTKRGWFGLDWVYVPVAGGATVKPGTPLIEDMNDWEELVVWPDLDAIDWKEMGEMNEAFLDTPQSRELGMLDGFWERLISLMDVSGAAMALIDEDQQDAVHAFFDKYADFMIDYIRRVREVCPIEGVLIHDDWGTQNGPFFSLETAREMLLPYLKRIVDYLHSEGMYYEQHSCGNCTRLAPVYVEAGVDVWNPQDMNDFDALIQVARGTRLHIAMPDACAPDASPEEAVAAAQAWFAKYGHENVTYAPFAPNPAFLAELYRLSREAFAK